MKSTVLMTAIVAGLTLTAMDASAAGRGGDRAMPDFATLDTDGSGTLSVAELEAAAAGRFAAMDINGDGGISAEELAANREGRAAKRAERMLSRLDANEDGLLQADEMKPRGASVERMMSRVDTNEDGEISPEEFEKMSDKRGKRGGKGRGDRQKDNG